MPDGARVRLPFTLLTNGGGDTEANRTDLVNKRMFAEEPYFGNADKMLSPSEMICCHTPLRKLVPALGDKFVLITGSYNPIRVCQ